MEDDKIKITMGGSMGFKMQGKQYESVDANSHFTLEAEVSKKLNQEELDSLSDKINNILEKDSAKRMSRAYELYKDKLENIRKLAGF